MDYESGKKARQQKYENAVDIRALPFKSNDSMPMTLEEARLRAAGRTAKTQVRPLSASRQDGSGDFLINMFSSLPTNISATVASAVAPCQVAENFYDTGATRTTPLLQGHGAQAVTPIRSAAPNTLAGGQGPYDAYAGHRPSSRFGGCEVPWVPAPPVLVASEDTGEQGHEGPYVRPFSHDQHDIQSKLHLKSRLSNRGRRSSIFVAIEQLDSVLEDAPLLAVLDVPALHGLQSERLRPSLCVPLPPQHFVIEDLQSDSRRYVFQPESPLAGAQRFGEYIHACVESTSFSRGYTWYDSILLGPVHLVRFMASCLCSF